MIGWAEQRSPKHFAASALSTQTSRIAEVEFCRENQQHRDSRQKLPDGPTRPFFGGDSTWRREDFTMSPLTGNEIILIEETSP